MKFTIAALSLLPVVAGSRQTGAPAYPKSFRADVVLRMPYIALDEPFVFAQSETQQSISYWDGMVSLSVIGRDVLL